jgi:PhnB protein
MSESNGTREGYHSITPRIVVDDVAAQVHFLRLVFEARGEVEPNRPAEMRIGDSLLMVTPATERERFPAFLYVYVSQADDCGWGDVIGGSDRHAVR